MRGKKIIALVLIVLAYIGVSYIIFSGTVQEIMTNEPVGTQGGGGSPFSVKTGVSDKLTVVHTKAVVNKTYLGFIKIPVRRGELNLSTYGFWFFNVIVPGTFLIFVLWEIYLQGKRWEAEGATVKI